MIWYILSGLSLLVVVGTLIGGIAVMAKGGETAAKWSNVLMRYRILTQMIAVLILLLSAYMLRPH